MNHIEKLVDGFKRFHSDNYAGNHALFNRLAKQGQSPKTIVVGCCDSRVDPAIVTSCDPGDLFIIRNVANLVPPFETSGNFHGTSAALEFGVRHLEVENIIVLGHAQCGGILTLLNQAPGAEPQEGFISGWMKVASHARNRVLSRMPGESLEVQARACEQEAILVSLDNLLTFPWILERVAQKNCRCRAGISIWSVANYCATTLTATASKHFPNPCKSDKNAVSNCEPWHQNYSGIPAVARRRYTVLPHRNPISGEHA